VGFANKDSDIYGNYLSNNCDDQIESDGGNRNVRIWGNFMENGFSAISTAPCAIGPVYMWRNVIGKISNGCFKLGSGGTQSYMGGNIYIFNTTVFAATNGPSSGVWNTPTKNVYTRNNIFRSIESDNAGPVDFDYDLCSGSVPSGSEANGIKGSPVFAGSGYNAATGTGDFTLSANSPGVDKGQIIANFADVYAGTAPDMGAQERGASPMQFGVNAYTGGPTSVMGQWSSVPSIFNQGEKQSVRLVTPFDRKNVCPSRLFSLDGKAVQSNFPEISLPHAFRMAVPNRFAVEVKPAFK
jgi:hypothetical protein